ncbi:putative leucine-rich repeat-containing protein DDB_G0290503 [Chironomus tepperi]|uniref:putative leucine-rich repeat-containing protein DDB_G0290503 n=1 Tax=Chironomus tepperi TaxID=113505 RepID=UPI00391FAC37
MRLKIPKFTSHNTTAIILSAVIWSTFPIAHSAPSAVTEVKLNCIYEITTHNSQDYYTCNAANLVNNHPNAEIAEVNGKHMSGYDSSKVEALIIEHQNVAVLPMKVGQVFENLIRFEVKNSALLEILRENFEEMDLKILKIVENPIEKIPDDAFDDLKNLEELDLSGNKIENFPSKNEKLKILTVDGNKIKELDLKNLQDLKTFSAKNNEIEELTEDLFENNPNLEVMFFSHNKLTKISPNLTQNLENLRQFDFTGNPCLKELSTIDGVTHEIDQLEGLFRSYCHDQTEIPDDTTVESETTEEPEGLTESTTLEDTTGSDDATDETTEETDKERNENIEEQVDDLQNNQNLSNSSISEGSENDQIEAPTVDKIEDSTDSQVFNTTEPTTTSSEISSTVPPSSDSQPTSTPTPIPNINSHKNRQMSSIDTKDQLDKICMEWESRNKSEADQPSNLPVGSKEAENFTVQGYLRDDKIYLIIKGSGVATNVDYEAIIEEKEAKIMELQDKVGDLEGKATKMAELEQQVKDLKAQNEMNLKKFEDSQQELQDKLAKIGKLAAKIDNQVKEAVVDQNGPDSYDLDEDIASKSHEISDSDPESSTDIHNSHESTTTHPEPNTTLDAASSSSSNIQQSFLDNLEAQFSLLLTKIDKLTLQNSKKSTKLSYLDKSLKICQDNKFSLELDIKLNSMSMQDRNKTLSLFEVELDACRNRTAELETVGRNYEMCRESNSRLDLEIYELRSTNRDLQGEKAEVLETMKELEQQNGDQNGDQRDKIEELEQQNGDQKDKMAELEKQNGDQKDKMAELEKQNGDQKDKIEELEQQNGDLKDKMAELERQNGDQKDKMAELEKQNGDLKDKIEELEKQNGDQKDKMATTKTTKQNLKT